MVQKFSQISQDAGDRCEPTGTLTGSLGSKIGDAVVELLNPSGGTPLGRLVLEAKDHSAAWSQPRLLAEAEAARGNRDAQASLLVCARAAMLPGGRSLLVLTPSDIAISWSPGDSDEVIRAAYLLLKLAVARGPQGGADGPDLPVLRDRAERAVRHLAAFDRLQRLLGTMSKNVHTFSTQLTQLRADLTLELDALSDGLRPAA